MKEWSCRPTRRIMPISRDITAQRCHFCVPVSWPQTILVIAIGFIICQVSLKKVAQVTKHFQFLDQQVHQENQRRSEEPMKRFVWISRWTHCVRLSHVLNIQEKCSELVEICLFHFCQFSLMKASGIHPQRSRCLKFGRRMLVLNLLIRAVCLSKSQFQVDELGRLKLYIQKVLI